MEFTKTSNFTLLVNKGPVSKPDAPNNHLHILCVRDGRNLQYYTMIETVYDSLMRTHIDFPHNPENNVTDSLAAAIAYAILILSCRR